MDPSLVALTRKPIGAARHAPGYIYGSEEVLALEKERLFMSDWLCVGRVEEVENPGDFLTHTVLGEPLVVARDEKGLLHAFYNQCRHRGVEVAAGCGNVDRFRCPYHAWTYDLQGQLIAAPFMGETPGFDLSRFRLKPLRVGVWAGWIFVSFNHDVRPLSEHVAFWEQEFGFLRQEDCRLAHKFTIELNCNWKLVFENLLDTYHVGTLHAKTIGKLQKPGRKVFLKPEGRLSVHYQAKTMTPDGISRIGKMPWLSSEGDDFARTGFLPPNMNMLARCDYVRPFVHWPLAVDRTRSIAYFLFPEEKFEQPGFLESVKIYAEYLQTVLEEDRTMVESLQRAMSTQAFEAGPFCSREQAIHHLVGYHLERIFPKDR